MISANLSNRLIFILSLLGLGVAAFLFYEYNLTSGPVICPIGNGCEIVRASPYSSFLGISIPFFGIVFYFTMAILSVVHSHRATIKLLNGFKLLSAIAAAGFGVYLTYLEAFVIKAFCFWCVISFIISLIILLVLVLTKRSIDDNRD